MTAVTSFASAAEGAGAGEADAFTAALGSVVDVVKTKAKKLMIQTLRLPTKRLISQMQLTWHLSRRKQPPRPQRLMALTQPP